MRIASRMRSAPRPSAFAVYSRLLERHRHVALRREVVDLVGDHALHDARDARRIGQIAVMQEKLLARFMRITIQMIDAVRVEERTAALDAMHLIALRHQQLGQVRPVLPGDAGDQCDFAIHCLPRGCDCNAARAGTRAASFTGMSFGNAFVSVVAGIGAAHQHLRLGYVGEQHALHVHAPVVQALHGFAYLLHLVFAVAHDEQARAGMLADHRRIGDGEDEAACRRSRGRSAASGRRESRPADRSSEARTDARAASPS